MKLTLKELMLLALLFAVANSEVNVVIVLDEGNNVAENGINGAINYAERNSLATIGTKTFITIDEDEDEEESHHTQNRVCAILDNLIHEGTPPDLILDISNDDYTSDVVKSISLNLGLPTVTSTMGEFNDLFYWMELSPEQQKYLIQVRGPHDLFPYILSDFALVTNISNAAVLYDEEFVMNHQFSNLFVDQGVQVKYARISTAMNKDSIAEKLKMLADFDLSNFFILGSNKNIKKVLESANEMGMNVGKYSWFAGTKDETAQFDASCCSDMKVLFFKPEPVTGEQIYDLKSTYGVAVTPIIEAAFYVDFGARAIAAVESMKKAGTWPALDYTKCSDFDFNNPSPVARSLDLKSAIQESSIPRIWGEMILSSNGFSYMDFNLHIELNTAKNNSLVESETVGMWTAGVPSDFSFDPMMEEKVASYSAKKIYRIVSVIQPPFMLWNETLKKWEGFCYDLAMGVQEKLGLEHVEIYMADSYGEPDENGNWNGLIGELVNKKADIGIGAISVMAERENVVDFSIPFYDLVGSKILMKRITLPTNLFKFFVVLEDSVWGCIIGAFFVGSVILWFFDKMSPYSYQNNIEMYEEDDEKRYFNFKESLWFCCTSLTPQGGGEAPKSLSARFMAATWWFFSFIIVFTFTANLAAFLTVSKLETPARSLDDLEKQHKIEFAPIEGTNAAKYFERMAYIEDRFYENWEDISLNDEMTEYDRSKFALWHYPVPNKYSKMWKRMLNVKRPGNRTGLPKDMAEALEMVRASQTISSGFALLADATDVKYLAMTNCDLQEVGQEFSRKPYAMAVQQGSPFKDQLNDAILTLMNERRVEAWTDNWWNRNPEKVTCEAADADAEGISAWNIGGVFIVIFSGIFLGLITLGFEYWYYTSGPKAHIGNPSSPTNVKDINGDFKAQNKW